MRRDARRVWSDVAVAYARSFGRLCAGAIPRVLDAASVTPGDRLLDVGCGTGLLATAALDRGAVVTAVDPDPDMVAMTEASVGSLAEVGTGGLPALPADDAAYDVVVANFVVNHVEDPAAAAAELRRVCAPGGRVVATVWTGAPSAQTELLEAVVRESGAVSPAWEHLPPERDFARTPEGLARLLADAGWEDAVGELLEWDWRISPDDFWAGPVGGVAGPGRTYRCQTPEVQQRMREVFDQRRIPLMQGEAMVLPSVAALARATA